MDISTGHRGFKRLVSSIQEQAIFSLNRHYRPLGFCNNYRFEPSVVAHVSFRSLRLETCTMPNRPSLWCAPEASLAVHLLPTRPLSWLLS
jgi:hypothetical protein